MSTTQQPLLEPGSQDYCLLTPEGQPTECFGNAKPEDVPGYVATQEAIAPTVLVRSGGEQALPSIFIALIFFVFAIGILMSFFGEVDETV